MANHRLPILILEQKAEEYDRIVTNGRYRFGDPEDQMLRYEEMARECRAGAEALRSS